MNVSEFINTHYHVVYGSASVDMAHFNNVDEFLLGDNHASIGHSQINSLFINTFSQEHDIVLVEAQPSMQPFEKDKALQAIWLTTRGQILGWDIGNIQEIMNSKLCEQTGNLAIETRILQRELLDQTYYKNEKEIKLEIADTIKKTGVLFDEMAAQHEDLLKTITDSFPARVQSMKDSLLKAKESSSRTFLIVGENHFTQEITTDSRSSLEDFYVFLRTRNVVILFPKLEKAQEMGKKINDIMKEVACLAMMSEPKI